MRVYKIDIVDKGVSRAHISQYYSSMDEAKAGLLIALKTYTDDDWLFCLRSGSIEMNSKNLIKALNQETNMEKVRTFLNTRDKESIRKFAEK